MSFPGGSDGKASAYNAGDPGSIPGLGRSSGEGKWQRTSILLPGKSHGWRSMVGYSPWDHKESETKERLHFHFHSILDTHTYIYISLLGNVQFYLSRN